jgi:uncharacterized protein with HEPN domain
VKSDRLFLTHILEAIGKIETYTNGLGSDDFLRQSLVQDGVMRQLEIIGEAVKNLSSEVKQARSDVRWKDIAGMRDRLIHGYFGVDLEAVWLTVVNDLPTLKGAVLAMLAQVQM